MGRNTQVHNPYPYRFKEPTKELTRREEQLLDLIVTGATNTEIAAEWGVSIKTVEAHVTHVMVKSGLGRRVLLALWWKEQK